ncbi:unnamed protein product [Ostreobium quekettii]|uniref:Uncharacterized protein n=1 Tax=Ostreobium quekettii TaxID=121088 RepID=A0A8S1JAS8_9CHLO|nr:unnamed protein product [Ostreobium quekettii]
MMRSSVASADPNDEWDYDAHHELGMGMSAVQILLTDTESDDEESERLGPGDLDWTSPMDQLTAEWAFHDHQEAVDPDLEVEVLTDKEEHVVDEEQTGEWDRPFADPSSTEDWNLDAQLDRLALDPCTDTPLGPELLRRRLENTYEQTVDGWLYEHEGEVDPESDGETASSSAHGERLRSRVCLDGMRSVSNHRAESPNQYRRVLRDLSDDEATTSSDGDHTGQGYPFGSDGSLPLMELHGNRVLLDFPWQCDHDSHRLAHSLGVTVTDSEQGECASSGGHPPEWEGLYDAGSGWHSGMPDFDAIDPGLDSEEGNGRSDREGGPSDGENDVEGSGWGDHDHEAGVTLDECSFEAYEGELFGESCSDPSRDSDCDADDGGEVASSVGHPSHYEDSEPED